MNESNAVEEAAAEDKVDGTTTMLELRRTCVSFAHGHDSAVVAHFTAIQQPLLTLLTLKHIDWNRSRGSDLMYV